MLKGLLVIFIIRSRADMVIPHCFTIFIKVNQCLDYFGMVVVVFIWRCIKSSLDLNLLVTPGFEGCTCLEFFDIIVFEVMISSLLTWSVVLIVGAFINLLSCTSFHEYPNPVSKDLELFSRQWLIIHNLLHFGSPIGRWTSTSLFWFSLLSLDSVGP